MDAARRPHYVSGAMRVLLLLSALLTALVGAGTVAAAPMARAPQAAVSSGAALVAPSRAACHRPPVAAAFRMSALIEQPALAAAAPMPAPLYAMRLRV